MKFVIVNESLTPLLGKTAAEKKGLLAINYNTFKSVNTVFSSSGDIAAEHHPVFDSKLGTLPGILHLEVKDDVAPVVCPPRKVPIALNAQLKAELARLKNLWIITEMDEPSDWVSQMAVTTKKNGLRS